MELDFFNEEGSGLGPTLEFYQLFSQEMLNPELNLWRKTDKYDLFPSPFQTFKSKKYTLLEIFELLGVLVGRAMLDGRIIQINISPVFWKILLNKPVSQ
jgi:E3 ubiquitin-protein ligase TRIP12